MAEAKLSLSWDAYQKNICGGLSQLQQRGEFVDMTLAADGHMVKVHQMVLSLVSPYIKDLISSAQCPHPVVFLNNISYNTLCAILEYIYTGEVHINKDNLSDLIAAGKALHIKGLKEMNDVDTSRRPVEPVPEDTFTSSTGATSLIGKLSEYKQKKKLIKDEDSNPVPSVCKIFVDEADQDSDIAMDDLNDTTEDYTADKEYDPSLKTQASNSSNVQFTVSNQGGLQIVHNRFIYHFRYLQKNKDRLWRCIDYTSSKCPARLFTNDKNEVIKRICSHTHPFHDDKILKKMRLGTIYSAFHEAEANTHSSKFKRNMPLIDSDTQMQ